MRIVSIVRRVGFGCALVATAFPAVITVKLGAGAAGPEIPADFVGLSFETSNLHPAKNGRYIFSGESEQLIHLFRTVGIRHLRIGGGTAEMSNYPVPGPREIDRLFAFARAAGVRVIYTLRLLNGDATEAAAIARYITDHDAAELDCFSIGNEPDWHSYHSYPGRVRDPDIFETTSGEPGTAYPSFLAKWRTFASAIIAAVPTAKFGGPDTGSNYPVPRAKSTEYRGKSWTEQFVADEMDSGRLVAAFHHDYVGEEAEDVSVPAAIDAMLSREWPEKIYPEHFAHILAPVQASGLPYRLTECNDHTGGVDGASNAFVSALWALDYLHWHAAHGARGVNFHNKRWIYTCTMVQDGAGVFHLNPKAYGLKAFDLGSHGRVEPLDVTNREALNLTAYAVRGTSEELVTLINKEHGAAARSADVNIALPTKVAHAEGIFLTAPQDNPRARSGITLGGAMIADDGTWTGKWTSLPTANGAVVVNVPPTSAAIVRISALQ